MRTAVPLSASDKMRKRMRTMQMGQIPNYLTAANPMTAPRAYAPPPITGAPAPAPMPNLGPGPGQNPLNLGTTPDGKLIVVGSGGGAVAVGTNASGSPTSYTNPPGSATNLPPQGAPAAAGGGVLAFWNGLTPTTKYAVAGGSALAVALAVYLSVKD
ncbi:MAG: hypothetical protein ACHQQR_00800 [Gemmatimonadales bacterium]